MTKETIFYFSSYKHPGCRVFGHGIEIDHIEVTAERDKITVHEVGSITVHEVGSTRVFGILGGSFSFSDLDKSFDVSVRAYSPVDNTDYRMDVKGCFIYDTTTGEFNAATLRPWYNAKTGEPVQPLNKNSSTQARTAEKS